MQQTQTDGNQFKGLLAPEKQLAMGSKAKSVDFRQPKKRRQLRHDVASIHSLERPFSEKDLVMQQTRKVSKILRESKAVTNADRSAKMLPLHAQYIDYVKQYPENAEQVEKKNVEEEIVRNILDSLVPPELQGRSNYFKQRPPLGYLTDKHTYASMKKCSSIKTRKVYVFDSYTAK